MITRAQLLMGRDAEFPLTSALEQNLTKLLTAVNFLQAHWWTFPIVVSSGYRPGHYNRDAGGSATSAHLTCQAVDILDPRQELSTFLLHNQNILAQCNMYMEDPSQTKTWCHLQIRPTKERVFKP